MYTHVYIVNTDIHTKSDTHVLNSLSVPTTKEKKRKKRCGLFLDSACGCCKNSGQNFKNSGFRDFPRVPKTEKW